MDMVLYDSGPGDDRMILMGCAELLDGLARLSLIDNMLSYVV